MQAEIGAASHVGHVRARNEDAYLTLPDSGVVAVADGLGGHVAGDQASQLAVTRLRELAADPDGPIDGAVLSDWLLAAHAVITERAGAQPALAGMGTTVVLATLPSTGAEAVVAHVGDSRAYATRDGSLARLTRDHADPVGGFITQALGLGQVVPEQQSVTLRAGDQLLLCTDGLTNMLSDDQIEARLLVDAPAQRVCDDLVEAALDRGGIDNVTVVLARVTG